MYSEDVKLIKEHVVTAGPSGFLDVCSVVLATIRTPFYQILTLTQSIKEEKQESKYLWGNKKVAYQEIADSKEEFFERLVMTRPPEAEALELLSRVTGLGLAKASFVLQMLGYNLACLDVHNLKEVGYSESYFSRKSKRLNEYVDLVQQRGAEYWWDTWCNSVAVNKYNRKYFNSGEEVSYTHVLAVKGEKP